MLRRESDRIGAFLLQEVVKKTQSGDTVRLCAFHEEGARMFHNLRPVFSPFQPPPARPVSGATMVRTDATHVSEKEEPAISWQKNITVCRCQFPDRDYRPLRRIRGATILGAQTHPHTHVCVRCRLLLVIISFHASVSGLPDWLFFSEPAVPIFKHNF